MPSVSLKIPFIQRNVTAVIEKELSKLFETPVKIGKVEINWLNRIVLKDLQIDDQRGETALKAGNMTAGFKLWPALKNKWILTTVRLFGVSCHIRKETPQSPSNIQFIIDALSSDSPGDNNLELQIQSVLIRRGSFTYDILSMENTQQAFNPNHIHVDNISGKLFIHHYSKDSIHARIHKLSLDEISGLNIEKLAVDIIGNRDSVHIDNLALSLPHSSILIPSACFRFTDIDSLSQRTEKSQLAVKLAPSKITPADFAALTPFVKDFSDVVEVSADMTGFYNSLSLNQLTLNYGKELAFAGNLFLKDVAGKGDELYLFGQIKKLEITTEGIRRLNENFKHINLTIPEPVMKLEELRFTGEIAGFTDNMVAFGNLSSPIGSVQMDMLIGYHQKGDTSLVLKGNIASSDLQISSILEEGNPFGNVRFNTEIDLRQTVRKQISGTINGQINEFDFREYSYKNIYLSGKIKENEYEGLVHVHDPNGRVELQGLFKNEDEKSVFDFMVNVTHLHPDKLNITDKYEKPDISFGMTANFTGNNPDDFDGYIELENLSFLTARDSFEIHDLRIETAAGAPSDDKNGAPTHKRMSITSDIMNGEITGYYSFASLIPEISKTVGNYLPAFIRSIQPVNTQKTAALENDTIPGSNQFRFDFTIDNTERISNTLMLPASLQQKTRINGFYNSAANRLSAEIDAPLFQLKGVPLKDGKVHLDNTGETMTLQVAVEQYNLNNNRNLIRLTSEAHDDRINTLLSWTTNKEEVFEAEIMTSALFIEDVDKQGKKKLRTEITIPSTQITLKDSLWTIEPASVTLADGHILIDNFYFTKGNQHLHIDGTISDDPKDLLFVDLNDIEISYIFDILNKPAIHFGGRATGTINARDLPGSMMIDGRLEVQDFAFHKAVQGLLKISSEWDSDRKGILLLGSMYKNDTTYTDVNGYIFPIGDEKGLSLYFDANEVNVAFLQKYTQAFSDSVSGLGFGQVHLYGSFSDVFVTGKPYIKDGTIKVNVLNTVYQFSDSLELAEKTISAVNTTFYDKNKNSGKLDFTLHHQNFRDLKYDLNLRVDKILAYDIPERINPAIYGKLYASGTATLNGTDDFIQVEGNVRSEAGTTIGFNFADHSTVEDYDFITFTDHQKDTISASSNNNQGSNGSQADTEMNYLLNFLVNVTPDAQMELMMDPTTGDKIRGNGSGNLQVQYGSQSDIQIFGNYLISGGTYNFSLQQVIRKRFNIREGSIVTFRGDPMDANLDIDAAYSLSANIQDLDETLIQETASPNVMVNCLLQLDGRLQNPTISFDMELPNSNAELERQVKSFIDTEDMMTRQIIYLLVLNKFYTPDYSRNDYRTNEFSAVASSAISAQLSNILNSLTDKVQIGTNIRARQDGIKDTEVEMLLSSQLLNNRLLFNGNFGYKDNYIQSNAFVGEFDLEYKLTRTGEISLKAYNHANDLYRYSKSLTRQGVGISFRKDFTILSDIFRRKRKEKEKEKEKEPEEPEAKTGDQASERTE